MPSFSRTWWGQKFIDALESFTDSGRLSRGRSYARGNKVKSFEIKDGIVKAQVRGSVNPYYGVYKEPLYKTVVEIQPISAAKWAAAIALIASKASYISKLLLNEMPDTIEDAFLTLGLNLLPRKRSEFKTSCSCPDYGDPCKHVAGVCYLLAAEFDRDPFLVFELRGLSKAALQAELAKSPLGIALSAELSTQATNPAPVESYYTQPQAIDLPPDTSLKEFWQSPKRFAALSESSTQVAVPAILVKKQGDAPAFWHKDASFIATMEELYERVKTKNRDVID
jgi:uncharacterized Zn finger protein